MRLEAVKISKIKGKWVSFNLHSPRDFKSMLQLIIDLLPEKVLKRMERM